MSWVLKPFVTHQQLAQHNAELTSQIEKELNYRFEKFQQADGLEKKFTELEKKVAELEKKIEAIQIPPPVNVDPLKNAIVNIGNRVIALENKVSGIQIPPPVNVDPLKNAIVNIGNRVIALENKVGGIQIPPPVDTEPLENKIAELEKKITGIQIPSPVDTEPLEEPSEKIFYLPEQAGAFILNERRKVLSQVKKALDVKELKKFLLDNPAAANTNFQRLLETHVKDLQKFANKLNLKDLNNEELSEHVTARYFKLFQKIIFDNLLIAIEDRLKSSDEFYPAFLAKLNEYLSRCGIYSVNARSGEKVSDEDFENMSPQILKTDDKNLVGTIKEIVRLPYRINYISETGDPKFLQYNGIMTLYQAVQ